MFSTEEKAKDFIDQSKENPIKYEDGSALECSLQDDHYKKKALEAANGGDTDREKRANDKQSKKEKRKDDLEKKTNEHLEKLNNENLAGALIHLGGSTFSSIESLSDNDYYFVNYVLPLFRLGA